LAAIMATSTGSRKMMKLTREESRVRATHCVGGADFERMPGRSELLRVMCQFSRRSIFYKCWWPLLL
jgi:hypothetical protein